MSNNGLGSAVISDGSQIWGHGFTCDHSCVVLAAGHLADTPPPEVFHWPWQARLEDERAVAQLTILTEAKGEDVVLWQGREH